MFVLFRIVPHRGLTNQECDHFSKIKINFSDGKKMLLVSRIHESLIADFTSKLGNTCM